MSDQAPATPLPSRSRARAVALVARALGSMPAAQLPAPLRPGVSFTPSRRVKLLGRQIAEALDDESFREHAAVQVRALEPALVAAVEADADAGDGADQDVDVIDAAAVAYVVRPDGWARWIERARDHEAADAPVGAERHEAAVARLTAALDRAKDDLKAQRERLKGQVDGLKADNAQLRRTLGATRTLLRDAEAARQAADDEARRLEAAAVTASRAQDAEIRRLRARIAELESGHAAVRRAARDDRDAEVVRLRLLLDTMSDAAAGLRRELALPPSDTSPADTVVALEPASDSSAVGAGRSMPDDDPALLRRLLELPRLHLIVDGYNVTKSAWPGLPLDRQRAKLVTGIGALVAGKRIETSVVFDGADLAHPPAVTSPRGVRVMFSPPGVIADDLIRQLVEAEPVGRPIVVVSSDREVARTVTKKGARALASMALIRAVSGP